MVKLIPVDPSLSSHVEFLYRVLTLRMKEPSTNISHQKMPTMEEHKAFLARKPYLAHYVIINEMDRMIGNCYVTYNREVGIYLMGYYRRMKYGSQVLTELKRGNPGPLYANINPYNKGSLRFFQRHGFNIVKPPQYVLEYQP